MKKTFFYVCCVCVWASACKKSPVLLEEKFPEKLWTVSEINRFIRVESKNKSGFDWARASDDVLFAALEHTDHILSVGYKIADSTFDLNKIHLVDIYSNAWQSSKTKILSLIMESEKLIHPNLILDSIIVWNEDVLPVINVFIRNPATIRMLRSSSMIRYVEPMGYDRLLADYHGEVSTQKINGSSGCDGNLAETGLQEQTDFQWLQPFARQSWNMNHHQIPLAWNRVTGKGIKIMIIDTGLETDQENLNGSFNQGYSVGRQIERMVTLPRNTFLGIPVGPVETTDDACGHGTAMAGVCAAPRGIDGNLAGVAYNCSLLTCRASSDVFLDESREVKGVSDAFTTGANRPDVHIQSMSLGRLTSNSQIRDAIYYSVGKGKLVFCAAGTSLSWTSGWYGVIFPASLPIVQAVTGVYAENNYQSCGACHDGESVDFTVVMEKTKGKSFPLTTAAYGDMPAIIGGSSVATATMAGMAALVWARYPTNTGSQILNRLTTSASFYPYKHPSLGWGNVNLEMATR